MREVEYMNIEGVEVEIDKGCVSLIDLFNRIGLSTKYCCEGYKDGDGFYIMFKEEVTDMEVESFLKGYLDKNKNTPFIGRFQKWCRLVSGEVRYNWIYLVSELDQAKYDYRVMEDGLDKRESEAIYGFRDGEDFIGLVWETDLGTVVSFEGKLNLNNNLQIVSAETQEEVDSVDLRNMLMSILPIKKESKGGN